MKSNTAKIYFKPYQSLSSLETAIKDLEVVAAIDCKITVVGKVTKFCSDKNIDVLKNFDTLKMYWQKFLCNSDSFGSFKNSEIGNVFIAGPLASTFLGDVNGKTLGTLSVGPFGIIRGMGASEIQPKTFLEMLNLGNYLVLFRGSESELEKYKAILDPL